MDCIEKIWNGKPSKEFDFLVDYNEQNHTYSIKCSEQEKLFFKLKTAFDYHANLTAHRRYFDTVDDYSTKEEFQELKIKNSYEYLNFRENLLSQLKKSFSGIGFDDLQYVIFCAVLESGLFYVKLIVEAATDQKVLSVILDYDLYEESSDFTKSAPSSNLLETVESENNVEQIESGNLFLNRVQDYLYLLSLDKELELYSRGCECLADYIPFSGNSISSEFVDKEEWKMNDIAKCLFIRYNIAKKQPLNGSKIPRMYAEKYMPNSSAKIKSKVREKYDYYKYKSIEDFKSLIKKGETPDRWSQYLDSFKEFNKCQKSIDWMELFIRQESE